MEREDIINQRSEIGRSNLDATQTLNFSGGCQVVIAFLNKSPILGIASDPIGERVDVRTVFVDLGLVL